jgi:hypothetical protein
MTVMTQQEERICRLVRELDLEQHRLRQAERQVKALRMTVKRLMAERQQAKPEPVLSGS